MLTTDNCPKAILGTLLTEKKHFTFTDDELVPGKSLVINRAGRLYLFMGDDPRSNPAMQIMVHDFGGNLAFLSMDCRKALELKTVG